MSAVRWLAPELDARPGDSDAEAPVLRPPTLDEIQAIQEAARREGYEEGLARGHQEGFGQGQAEVRRHPDDIATLAPLLTLVAGVRLAPDPALGRGDLRVHAEAARIDGTLEARLRGALESVIHKAGSGP